MSIGIKELQRERMFAEIIAERDSLIEGLHADILALKAENERMTKKLDNALSQLENAMRENANADSP